MDIEIKKSIKPVNYFEAIDLLESRLKNITANKEKELIWILEHPEIFTAGTSYKENEIIDKSIDLLKTNRGGKITYHGPGQLICYFVIDLREKKDIRKFITTIENTIIQSLKKYNKIVPCGISDKGITNLKKISNQDYSNLNNEIIENFISNLKI